jgi:hypothetical protein
LPAPTKTPAAAAAAAAQSQGVIQGSDDGNDDEDDGFAGDESGYDEGGQQYEPTDADIDQLAEQLGSSSNARTQVRQHACCCFLVSYCSIGQVHNEIV